MYVFLDVDGVLNTESDWGRKVYSLNGDCVAAFCRLLSCLHEPKVVLSSTWRNGIARDGTTAVHIDDLLKALEPTGIMSFDKTGVAPDGRRTKEIDYYLRRHPEDQYIILDDDTVKGSAKNTLDDLKSIDGFNIPVVVMLEKNKDI